MKLSRLTLLLALLLSVSGIAAPAQATSYPDGMEVTCDIDMVTTHSMNVLVTGGDSRPEVGLRVGQAEDASYHLHVTINGVDDPCEAPIAGAIDGILNVTVNRTGGEGADWLIDEAIPLVGGLGRIHVTFTQSGNQGTLAGSPGRLTLLGSPFADHWNYVDPAGFDLDDDGEEDVELTDWMLPNGNTFHGGSGNDTIDLGADLSGYDNGISPANEVFGEGGNDILIGSNATDNLYGGSGDDVMSGWLGSDSYEPGEGADTVTADQTDANPEYEGDVVRMVPDGAADDISGNSGYTRVLFIDTSLPLTISLDGVANDGASGEADNIHHLNSVTGGSGNDVLTAGDDVPAGVLDGYDGNDTLIAGTAADYFSGGAGTDVVDARASGLGRTVVMGGNDRPPGSTFLTSVEEFLGGSGADDVTVSGDLGGEGWLVRPGLGNDTVHLNRPGAIYLAEPGADGKDTISGSGAGATASYALRTAAQRISLDGIANDGAGTEGDNVTTSLHSVLGGAAGDTLIGSDAGETLNGGLGNDTLSAGKGQDLELGGAGNDTFLEGSTANGSDQLRGGSGTDTVSYAVRSAGVFVVIDATPNDGAFNEKDLVATDVENVIGSRGNDILKGSSAANTLTGGVGADKLYGLAGNDSLIAKDGKKDLVDGGAGGDRVRRDSIDAVKGCEFSF